jgi:hypothetical protein
MYEALRAYFVEDQPSADAAKAFGYTPGSFRVLCHQFRRDPAPAFFVKASHGPRSQPKKSAARDLIVVLRKQNHSVYEISEELKSRKLVLSPTAVREVLKEEGFAPLPRRLDEERPYRLGPTAEPVADVRSLSLAPRTVTTSCGGLFLFVPDLIRLGLDKLARAAHLPGSTMIPAEHALRACLALKLWCVERRSHVMALVADEGLALFAGLNAIPKKSFLSEYSSRIDPAKNSRLLASWHQLVEGQHLFAGDSFNLDFHSVPYYVSVRPSHVFEAPRRGRCSCCPRTGEEGHADGEEGGCTAGGGATVLAGGRRAGRGRGVAEQRRDALGVREAAPG